MKTPISLSDQQMDTVRRAAAPLLPCDRGPFLEEVARELGAVAGPRRRRFTSRRGDGAVQALRPAAGERTLPKPAAPGQHGPNSGRPEPASRFCRRPTSWFQ